MTDAEYSGIEAMNFSSLKHIGISPLMFQWRRSHPEPRKPSFVFGGATHTATLEPEKFASRYALFEGTRKGKVWDAWQLANPGVESLKPDDMERLVYIFDGLINGRTPAHKLAWRLLQGCRHEEVLTWTDLETGLKCKGRLDGIRPERVLEVKTTVDPKPLKFGRDAANFGYAGQAAFYHDGAVARRRIDGRQPPIIIALQTKEPYDVAVYELGEQALLAGRRLYRSLLRAFVMCTHANMWPGVAPDLMPLMLPPWAEERGLSTEDEEESF